MRKLILAPVVGACLLTSAAFAHDEKSAIRADGHAPIGVMGDHMHKAGEFMFSYRYMFMEIEGNRIGTSPVDPATVATTVPNRFFGLPGQPPTLRVVPLDMQMQMLGAMWAPSDSLTLMVMASYLDKTMNHVTFQGGAGTTVLGNFRTDTHGVCDTKIARLIRLFEDETHHVHFNAGLSVPTGSIDESGVVLAPNGATPRLRLPYAIQFGSGTLDLLPGLTYSGRTDEFGWGAQASGTFRLGRNSEGYSLGDGFDATAWASYAPAP